jgi:hypothetical protein
MLQDAGSRHDLTQGFEFINRWLHVCWDALVDEVGLEAALAGYEKVGINAGKAAAHNLIDWELAKDESPSSIVIGYSYFGRMIGWGVLEMRADDEVGCIRVVDCQLGPGKHPYCPGHCGPLCTEMTNEMRAGYDNQYLKCLGKGDNECLIVYKPQGVSLTEEALARRRLSPVELPSIPGSMRLQLVPNLLHWSWTFSVNSTINALGKEKAQALLQPLMRREGMTHPLEGDTLEDHVAKMMGKLTADVRTVPVDGGHELTIDGCPFIGHSQEICALFHAFLDGMAEASSRSIEWTETMVEGRRICHARILKQAPSRTSGLLETLQARLVRGEITFDEYQRIKAEIAGK